MKLTSLLLVVFCMHLSASTHSQTVSIDANNQPLSHVLRTIKKQTDLAVVYNDRFVNPDQKVSIHVESASLTSALESLLKPLSLTYHITEKTIVIAALPHENTNQLDADRTFKVQQRMITGKVTDEEGHPLEGVTVRAKGVEPVVTTGSDGNYQISLPRGAESLVFTIVGYEAEERAVGTQNILNVSMQTSLSDLGEVVVVGYSEKSLSQLSSSVAVVTASQLEKNITSNSLGNLLQGKVPGVIVSNHSGDPNSSPTVLIRGSSSVSAGSSPLYVVDGIIGGSANPNDIHSVTILKDAGATGLYGSRAANGVIVITTKSGRDGKSEIGFSSRVGLNSITTGKFSLMNAQELYDYQKSFYSPEDFLRDRPESLLSQNTDWMDMAYRTGMTQEVELSVRGGNSKTNFYISGNYYKEDGTLRNTGISQYNIRTNLTHKLNDKFKLSLRLNAGIGSNTSEASDKQGRSGATYAALVNLPWDNPYDTDGRARPATVTDWIGRDRDNFVYDWQFNHDRGRSGNAQLDINLDYNIFPGLIFSTYNRANTANSNASLYYDLRSKPGRGVGSLADRNDYNRGLITSNRLSYDKKIGDHSVNLLAVGEVQRTYADNGNVYGEGFVAGISVMNAASTILRGGGGKSEIGFNKALIQADYNYKNRYFAVGSLISESSSLFGANNRSANFFTLGASWMLSNEQFMSNMSFVDLLKIRSTYGTTGNANIGNYQSLQLYSFNRQYVGSPASFPSQMANPDLTWEKARMLNVGLDLNLFRRVNLTVDLYDKTSSDLLLNVQVPLTSGFEYNLLNQGSVRNRGVELMLNTKNIRGAFTWETDFNIAFNRNKVLRLDNEGADIIVGDQIISVGDDMNTWYLRKWMGVDRENGDPLWETISYDAGGGETRTTTNSFSDAPLQKIGGMSPNFTGGIGNTFSYKGFSLSAFFNFVNGNKILDRTRHALDNDGFYISYNSMKLIEGWSRWEEPGNIATHPKPVVGGNKNSNSLSTRYLEDGSYLRMRSVILSYSFHPALISRIKLNNASIFVSGDNLWTLTKYSGMDPEVVIGPINGGGTANTISEGSYPISKKVLFGINIGF